MAQIEAALTTNKQQVSTTLEMLQHLGKKDTLGERALVLQEQDLAVLEQHHSALARYQQRSATLQVEVAQM